MRVLLTCLALIATSLAQPAWSQQPDDLDALSEAEAEARSREAALQADRDAVSQEIDTLKSALRRDTEQTRAFEQRRSELLAALSETE